MVAPCAEMGIEVLTLFAFSSENWRRPKREVALLMELFFTSLQEEAMKLSENNVRLRVIGDDSAFPSKLRGSIDEVQKLTQGNSGLILVIAANYGGVGILPRPRERSRGGSRQASWGPKTLRKPRWKHT